MPPHNSHQTASVTLYAPDIFQGNDLFGKTVCLYRKKKVSWTTADGDEVIKRSLSCAQQHWKKKKWRWVTGDSEVPWGSCGSVSALCEQGSQQRWCVRPMCVSEDKTCGSALCKNGGTHLRFMKKRLSEKVISGVVQRRLGRPSHRVTDSGNGRRETDRPNREKQRQNSWL